MTMAYTNFQSFAEVEAHYNNIKPLVSKRHTLEQDVRPVGDRKRKYERIKKVNRNCYVMMDGYYSGDDVFRWWFIKKEESNIVTEKELIRLAPIVWRRHKDGTETVKFRNGTGRGIHNGRYSFIKRNTPSGISFHIHSGKQFVNGVYLAKGSSITKDDHEREPVSSGWQSWWAAHVKECTHRDDGCAVTFKLVKDGLLAPKWKVETGGKPLPKPPRTLVDKKTKATMQKDIDAFREWGFTMYAMLPKDDREYTTRIRTEVKDYITAQGLGLNYYSWDTLTSFADHPLLTREVIKDDQHPLRVHLAYGILSDVMSMPWGFDQELPMMLHGLDDKEIKVKIMSSFNQKINRTCDLLKTVKG